MVFAGNAKLVTVCSVLVLLSSYLYRRHMDVKHLDTVLMGLLEAERAVPLDSGLRVAVGFGSCVDVIGSAMDVLAKLSASVPDKPEHFNTVHNQEEFEKIFAYFFRHGAAAERYMSNETFFHKMADIAKSFPETKVVVGGNAPVMAKSFLRQGVKVLLGAQMTEELRRRIGTEVEIAGNEVSSDDIHLILEYHKGEKWGEYESPRANRFIIHNDFNNPLLSTLESFAEAIIHFSPHLVVIGGLQMMDNFPFLPGQRRKRLDKLSAILTNVPAATHVHFEMASFAEQDCLADVVDTVVRYSDSLGMNEQELPNLLGMLADGSVTLVSDPTPRIATTLDQMRTLYALLRRTAATNGRRPITRLHVHTLAFQAIMTQRGSTWKNSRSAAAKASLAANRHTCGSAEISSSTSRLLMDDSFATSALESGGGTRIEFSSERPVSCWREGDVDVCLAPVLICTNVVQTVGGGDNISSAGLVLQL